MAMEVIGAGFPRTGTTTLKMALEMLGFSKTYHFKDLFAFPEKVEYWNELEDTGSTNFDALFEGYVASVDFPGYPYYKTFMEVYPEARVILTVRDFEAWYESTAKTIHNVVPETIIENAGAKSQGELNTLLQNKVKCIEFLRSKYFTKELGGVFTNKEAVQQIFENHIAEVKRFVPASQLLVYEVTDGWEPLCAFLGKDVPQVEFPHLNKKEGFKEMLGKMVAGVPPQG